MNSNEFLQARISEEHTLTLDTTDSFVKYANGSRSNYDYTSNEYLSCVAMQVYAKALSALSIVLNKRSLRLSEARSALEKTIERLSSIQSTDMIKFPNLETASIVDYTKEPEGFVKYFHDKSRSIQNEVYKCNIDEMNDTQLINLHKEIVTKVYIGALSAVLDVIKLNTSVPTIKNQLAIYQTDIASKQIARINPPWRFIKSI